MLDITMYAIRRFAIFFAATRRFFFFFRLISSLMMMPFAADATLRRCHFFADAAICRLFRCHMPPRCRYFPSFVITRFRGRRCAFAGGFFSQMFTPLSLRLISRQLADTRHAAAAA